jgi:hypothetical protein
LTCFFSFKAVIHETRKLTCRLEKKIFLHYLTRNCWQGKGAAIRDSI